MKHTWSLVWLVLFVLLCTTDVVLSQRISKKILTEGKGEFNAPITVGKGMPFSITFNDIKLITEIAVSSTDFSGTINAKSGTITGTPFTVTLAPGDYTIKETYYGSVGAAQTLIPIPTLEIPKIVIERNLSVQTLSEYTIEVSTTIYNLRVKLSGDFEGSMRIRETVSDKVVVPFKSVRKLAKGVNVVYEAEFSAYAASDTKISSRELVTPEVSLSLNSDNQIKVNWYQIGGAESYLVYRSLEPVTNFDDIQPIAEAVKETNFTDLTADLNTVYYYGIAAIDIDGNIKQMATDVPNGILWINKDGATCEYANGTKIVFPENLLGQPESIYLAYIDTVPNNLVATMESAIGKEAYVVSVLAQEPISGFDSLASLTLSYTDDIDDKFARPQIFVLQGNQWIRLINQNIDLDMKSVTAKIESAGIYCLALFEPIGTVERIWDINKDNNVNIFDLVLVASQFGESGENLKGDVNKDNDVNIFDLVLVARHFGETYGISASPTIISNSIVTREVSLRAIATDNHETTNFQVVVDSLDSLNELAGYQITFCGLKSDLTVVDAGLAFLPRSTYLAPTQRNQDQLIVSAVAYNTEAAKPSVYQKGHVILLEIQLNDTQNNIELNNVLLSNTNGHSIPLVINPEIDSTIIEDVSIKTEIKQNYPNPFNPETWIPFTLSSDTVVRLIIYDHSGLEIQEINLGLVSQGNYISKEKSIYWDGRNQHGEKVASGIYFYRLDTTDIMQTKKMIILK